MHFPISTIDDNSKILKQEAIVRTPPVGVLLFDTIDELVVLNSFV